MRAAFAVVPLVFAALAAGQPVPPKSGREFQSEDVRRLQSDDFANPAMLWAAHGESLWNQRRGAKSVACANCHGEAMRSMKGIASRLPAWDESLGRVVDLEGRVAACGEANQGATPFAPESDDLIALSAYVAQQSRGMPVRVNVDGQARALFERGRALFSTRIGQLNLACAHCHDANWGKTLLAEPISQGQPTGWPAYRLEWQKAGSLQRRLRACFFGVRAEVPAFGSEDLVALELFLAWRAQGLAMEAPGVRR
jgi:sulfur-oxidizing protein SoxA